MTRSFHRSERIFLPRSSSVQVKKPLTPVARKGAFPEAIGTGPASMDATEPCTTMRPMRRPPATGLRRGLPDDGAAVDRHRAPVVDAAPSRDSRSGPL